MVNKESRWKKIFSLTTLLLILPILFTLSANLYSPQQIAGDDFSQSWAAARTNISGGNPYDGDAILLIRETLSSGLFQGDSTLIMPYPPWIMTITMPLALFSYSTSRFIWLLINICIMLFCSTILWKMYNGPQQGRPLAWVIAFTLFPTILVFEKGQVTPIILLSIVGFLYTFQQRQYFLSGLFVSLTILKPHLVYLFLIVLFLWIIQSRPWRILGGFLAGFIIVSLVPYLVNHSIYLQYLNSLGEILSVDWATPTLGTGLRIIFGVEKSWLKFIPPITGVIWLFVFWFVKRHSWDWVKVIPVIIAVSLTTAYFGWIYDSVLLVIVIIPGILYLHNVYNTTSNQKNKYLAMIFTFLYIILDIFVLIIFLGNNENFFILFPLLILVWFGLSTHLETYPQDKLSYNYS